MLIGGTMAKAAEPPRRFSSIDRAAQLASVSTKTIRRRIADGSITGYRFGPRVIRVDLDEVESLFKRMPTAKCWGQ
jgi:excisionase family DNA binding protein